VNRNTDAAYNDLITPYAKLPWLQDTVTNSAWALWQVTYRDVRILDSSNRLFAIYNLTSNDLYYSTNRDTLKKLFLNAARLVDSDSDRLPDDWEWLTFGNLTATADGDADGDGVDNYSEYAFGTDPRDPKSKTSFQSDVTGTGTNRVFAVTFRRRAGSWVDYFIESSLDLTQWSSSPGTINLIEPFRNLFDGTGTGQTTAGLTAPVSSQPGGYLRIRAVPRSQP
jgi:hypothetical protein